MRKKDNKIINAILSCSKMGRMQVKINTLELENETLKRTISDELYSTFMEKLNEPTKIEHLIAENKRLRKKNKLLKEMLLEDKNSKVRSNKK